MPLDAPSLPVGPNQPPVGASPGSCPRSLAPGVRRAGEARDPVRLGAREAEQRGGVREQQEGERSERREREARGAEGRGGATSGRRRRRRRWRRGGEEGGGGGRCEGRRRRWRSRQGRRRLVRGAALGVLRQDECCQGAQCNIESSYRLPRPDSRPCHGCSFLLTPFLSAAPRHRQWVEAAAAFPGDADPSSLLPLPPAALTTQGPRPLVRVPRFRRLLL